MSKRDAKLFEVLIGQVAKDRDIDIALGKALRVLGHAELFSQSAISGITAPSFALLDRQYAEFILPIARLKGAPGGRACLFGVISGLRPAAAPRLIAARKRKLVMC